MYKCALDPEIFCERVLGLILKPFHREWLRLLMDDDKDRLAISAPTGFGKTTIFGVAYPLWLSIFKPNSRSLIVSKTIRTQSSNVLDEVKRTIENNELLSTYMSSEQEKEWSKEKLVITNGSSIFYSSYATSVRGVHVDYIFADEVATYLETETYFRDVTSRAVAKKGKIAAVSTPLNTTDLLAQLMNNKVYFSRSYPAIVNGESIWAERFPINELMRVKLEQGESNFEKNYMCNPIAESENAVFPIKLIMECFNYETGFNSNVEGRTFLGCDFAVAKGPTADFDAYVVIEKLGNSFIIKHIEIHRGFPIDAKVRRIIQLNELYKPVKVIIDESGIGTAILEELRSNALPIIAQSFHSAARNNLLMSLKNILDGKKLVIPRSKDDSMAIKLTDELVAQLIGFKETKSKATGSINYLSQASHDDIVMALAMAVKESNRQKSTSVFSASSS
jgi:hypothetical protein